MLLYSFLYVRKFLNKNVNVKFTLLFRPIITQKIALRALSMPFAAVLLHPAKAMIYSVEKNPRKFPIWGEIRENVTASLTVQQCTAGDSANLMFPRLRIISLHPPSQSSSPLFTPFPIPLLAFLDQIEKQRSYTTDTYVHTYTKST